MKLILIFFLLFLFFKPVCAQNPGYKGYLERIKVHGKSLEGNLEGDSPDRDVSVYLPASYYLPPQRSYPVIYFLHGFTDDDAKYSGLSKHWMSLPPILDSDFKTGASKEMIVVIPNAYTRFQGSWYSNSETTGNWEDFIAEELVGYIDAHYRTIAKAASRGLAGHSMGGYGALRIGEKHPEIFSSIYLLSPADISMGKRFEEVNLSDKLDSIKTIEQFNRADFETRIIFAEAVAWSPNRANPPFYCDLPIKNGQIQKGVLQKWSENMPIERLEKNIGRLKQLHAIAFDAGNRDERIATGITLLHKRLDEYSIRNTFEIYPGTHISAVAERIRLHMLPFFSANLSFVQ